VPRLSLDAELDRLLAESQDAARFTELSIVLRRLTCSPQVPPGTRLKGEDDKDWVAGEERLGSQPVASCIPGHSRNAKPGAKLKHAGGETFLISAEILRVGGVWDNLKRDWRKDDSGARVHAQDPIIVDLQESQLDATKWFAERLAAFRERRKHPQCVGLLLDDRRGGKTFICTLFMLCAAVDVPTMNGDPCELWIITQSHPARDEIDQTIKDSKPEKTKISLTFGKSDECKAECLNFDNFSMVNLSRAPLVTEDINFGLGLSLLFAAEKKCKNAMIVDQHNSETGEITSFEPGSVIGYNYHQAIEDSLKKVAKSKSSSLNVGYSESGTLKSSSIGNAGIKVVSISSDPISVIILIDSNGVSPQFKDQLDRSAIEAAKSLNLSIVPMVCTTDTHQLNNVRGVLNPLKEEGETLSLVSSLVKKSLEDMSPSTYFASSSWVDVKVIGAKQSIELISTVNSIVAISKFILPLILLASLLLLVTVATSI
jgi:hypothetical protein